METQWLPVSLVVWITALAGTLDARQQVRFVALCTGLSNSRLAIFALKTRWF